MVNFSPVFGKISTFDQNKHLKADHISSRPSAELQRKKKVQTRKNSRGRSLQIYQHIKDRPHNETLCLIDRSDSNVWHNSQKLIMTRTTASWSKLAFIRLGLEDERRPRGCRRATLRLSGDSCRSDLFLRGSTTACRNGNMIRFVWEPKAGDPGQKCVCFTASLWLNRLTDGSVLDSLMLSSGHFPGLKRLLKAVRCHACTRPFKLLYIKKKD